MKTIVYNSLFIMALLMGVMLTGSCSKDDAHGGHSDMPVSQFFTTTLNMGTVRSVNADGKTVWTVGEQIALYYQKTDDSFATATASVTEVSVGVATITATLVSAKNGSAVKFVYPAGLMNLSDGTLDASKLASQHGTLADISANYDGATGSAILATDGTTCSTTATVSMVNRVLIGKIIPKLNGNAIDGITRLTINDGTNSYVVTPSSGTFGTSGIYVAMLPMNNQWVSMTASTYDKVYGFGGKRISLEVGKLYNNLAISFYDLVILNDLEADYTIENGRVVGGILEKNVKVSIADGATVTFRNVSINANGGWTSGDYAGITCLGNATIVLEAGTTNTVKGFAPDYSGIFVPSGHTLTISGSGTLTASNNNGYGAGIGGGNTIPCGNIVMEGGTIQATGGKWAAGIGSGNNGSCGNITIKNTVTSVTATKGAEAPNSIGAGSNGSCGTVTIESTNVVQQ